MVPVVDAAALLQQAIQLHQSGAAAAAGLLYRRVLKTNPNQPTAAYNLALLEADSGRLRAAEAILERLLRAHPNEGSAHHSYARLLERGDRFAKCLFHLRRATRLIPNELEPYLDLIRVCGVTGQMEEARQVAEIAAGRFPRRSEVPLQFGVALAASGNINSAKPLFLDALGLDPHLPIALYNLARIADAEGEPGKALSLYREARAADPGSKLPDTNTGDLELKIGAVEEAIRSHETWLTRHPTHADVLSNRLLAAQYEPDMTSERLLDLHKQWDLRFGQAGKPRPKTPKRGGGSRAASCGSGWYPATFESTRWDTLRSGP